MTSLKLFLVSTAGLLLAQPQTDPAFEVASIRLANPNRPNDMNQSQAALSPDQFQALGTNVFALIRNSYDLHPSQIVGGPPWIASEKFDIVAKAAGPISRETRMLMVKRLLADRFHLKAHTEKREMPIYSLDLSRADKKPGSKLRLASEKDCLGPGEARTPVTHEIPAVTEPIPCGAVRFLVVNMNGRGVPMRFFAKALAGYPIVGRVVLDRTGLGGTYDFDLEFQGPGPVNPEAPARPDLFTALPEQLGVKLNPGKELVEVLVIDSADHPSEN